MSKTHEIIPAIMPSSYEDLKDKADAVVGCVSWAQIDVMDGIFVNSVSWPYGVEDFTPFHEMVENGEKLPHLDKLNYEIDLMVEHPEEEIPKWLKLGASRFIVHFESISNADVLEHIILRYSKKGTTQLGIALSMETPVDNIEPILSEIDCVQLMGINRIGYQGEEFSDCVLDKVKNLREIHKDCIISVDGGVSLETAGPLLSVGVDRLVSGSAVFGQNDISEVIQLFKNL